MFLEKIFKIYDKKIDAIVDRHGFDNEKAGKQITDLMKEAIERINNSPLKEVICTNTIKLKENKKSDKIVQLSVGHMFGRGVLNIIQDKPLSKLFEYEAYISPQK